MDCPLCFIFYNANSFSKESSYGMSCYMRHLDWLLDSLGIEINKTNRKLIDQAIRKHYSLSVDTTCPQVWDKLKNLTEEEKIELSEKLKVE